MFILKCSDMLASTTTNQTIIILWLPIHQTINIDDDMILANTERWLCTVRYGYSSLFFSFCLTSITLTHSERIVCVDMTMDTLHGTFIGHTPDSFTGESLQSTTIVHYLHRQHARPGLENSYLQIDQKYSPHPSCMHWVKSRPPPKCYLCRKSIKTNDHKLIHCDRCSNWIHRNCCNIDDSEYRQLVHSTCSWACPECNHFNFSNSFFDDTEILTSNQFDPLDNVNRIKTKNPQSSKNGRNNKGHKTTKR